MRTVLILLAASTAAVPAANLPDTMKSLAFEKKVDEARKTVEEARAKHAYDDPELLAALSWAARGASFAEQWGVAEGYARETYEIASRRAAKDGVDSSPELATALGAAIEVLGAARVAAGKKDEAVAFLKAEREKYRGTSIETRTQKNVLTASLEGSPMPNLEPERYLGPAGPPATEGKVAVYYFWAHWCRSSRKQKPDLITLHDRYADKGLTVVGPTKLFGYRKNPADKVEPAEEIAYIEGAWQAENPLPEWMSKPLREDFFTEFGVSTTPTIVITDRQGLVRVYHPGLMTLEELEAAVKPLL